MDEKGSWKRFQRLTFDSKKLSKRARRMETVTTKHAHKFVLKRLANLRESSRFITFWLVLVSILIASTAFQTAWSQSSYQVVAPVPGGTYAEGMLGPINTLNPLYATTDAELSAERLIFSSLFDYDQTGHLRDDIATGYSVDHTGKVYTISLRRDAQWQDGTNVTAEDVVYTVNTMKDPNARSIMRATWTGIDVKALDEHTVQFTLPVANSPFPFALTFAILPEHILSSVNAGMLRESAFSLSPIGSGPFRLKLLQTVGVGGEDKIAQLVAWKGYYGATPKLVRFEVHAYSTPANIVKALKSHEINAAIDINGLAYEVPKIYQTKDYPIDSGVYALLNMKSATLRDATVRKALQLGTDTSQVRSVLSVKAPALDLPVLSHEIATTKLPAKPALDKAQAAKLLDKAGWKMAAGQTVRTNKRGARLTLRLTAVKDNEYNLVVDNLAKQWRDLGIEVKTSEFDPTQSDQSFAQAVLQPRDYDVLVNELTIGADPDVYAYWYSGEASALGRNYANYQNQTVDTVLLSARQVTNQALRDRKYASFATQWLNDVPAIGLYQSVMEYARLPDLTAFPEQVSLPSPVDRYTNVINWTSAKGTVYKTP